MKGIDSSQLTIDTGNYILNEECIRREKENIKTKKFLEFFINEKIIDFDSLKNLLGSCNKYEICLSNEESKMRKLNRRKRATMEQITPSPGSSCPSDEVCATKSSCDYWVEKESSVKNLPRSSSQVKQYLSEAKAAVCNRKERALCCPINDMELINPSPGSSCPNEAVCATRSSCYYWKQRLKHVENLPRNSSQLQQYVSHATAAICNRKERALCCPINAEIPDSLIRFEVPHIPN